MPDREDIPVIEFTSEEKDDADPSSTRRNTSMVRRRPASLDDSSHRETPLVELGKIANERVRHHIFAEYLQRRADNTLKRQLSGLRLFSAYLDELYQRASADAEAPSGEELQTDPEAWRGVTHGIVQAFLRWQFQQGYAVDTVNVRLSTVRTYAKLAMRAGVIPAEEYARLENISGFSLAEGKRIDNRREKTRVGPQKREAIVLTHSQIARLKRLLRLNTPPNRRDALLIHLLLDHGFRRNEVLDLTVGDFNLDERLVRIYRSKVEKTQRFRLSPDAFTAAQAYLTRDLPDAPPTAPVLRGSTKSGTLRNSRLSQSGADYIISKYGRQIDVEDLSSHDFRHTWALRQAELVERGRLTLFQFQEMGGWSTLDMARRYVEDARVANEGLTPPT